MNKIAFILRESQTARFFIPAGIMIIIFSAIFFNVSVQNKNYIKTESTVTNVVMDEEAHTDANGDHVDASYTVTVKYTVDGKEYEADLSGLSEYKEGDKMTIYYNPDDPSLITQTKSLIIPLIMAAAGIAAFIFGIISGMGALKRYNKLKDQEKEWTNG